MQRGPGTGWLPCGTHRTDMLHSAIRLMTPGLQLAGSTLPVRVSEGDNLAIRRALDGAEPSDVLKINGHDAESRAVFGGILGEPCWPGRSLGGTEQCATSMSSPRLGYRSLPERPVPPVPGKMAPAASVGQWRAATCGVPPTRNRTVDDAVWMRARACVRVTVAP
jgi:hypothetical protein